MVWVISPWRQPEGDVKLRGGKGFVKEVGFKPRLKVRVSYGWAEWWNKGGKSDTSNLEIEELVPEWGWRNDKGGCEKFVGKWEEFVFDVFSDFEQVERT